MTQAQHRWHAALLEHMSWLRSVVRARLGDPDSVEDVLNDVLTDALALSQPTETIQCLGPWLYRLAIRKSLLFRRKCGRRRRAYRSCAEFVQARDGEADVTTPLEQMLHAERQAMVRHAMLQLGGQDAEVLMLKYVHHWSYDEISKNLGVDYGKVVHRLRRARKRLREELLKFMPDHLETKK